MKKNDTEVKIYDFGAYDRYKKLRLARYIAIIVCVLTLLFTFVLFKDDMSVGHFKYLIRNLEFNPNSVLASDSNVYYDSDENSTYALYKGGIAVLGSQKISLYDMTSSATLSLYHGYKKPSLRVSDKYMLVFDRDGNGYSIYNAFSLLKDFEAESSVTHAAVSDSGVFAVALADDNFYSRVLVYNANFVLINEIKKFKYVMGMDINPDGDRLLLTSVYIDDGGLYTTEIMLMKPGKSEALKSITVSGTAAWDCRYLADGSFVLVSDNGLRYYSSGGDLENTVAFGSVKPDRYYTDDDCVVLVYCDKKAYDKNLIAVYNKNGRDKVTATVDGNPVGLCATGYSIYMATSGTLVRMSRNDGKCEYTDIEAGARGIMRDENNRIYICWLSKAKRT